MPDALEWDVVVVDNNSSDQTRRVVESFCQRFPKRFEYYFEPRQGKSFALNSGVRKSKANVIAFVDDDVEVDSNWLNNLTRHLTDGPWSGVGGRILPEAGFTPPQWMETGDRYSLAPLAVFDRGSVPGELEEPPFGTNMAFRREMFLKYRGFRTDLGPLPGSDLRHNEDSEFGSRLLAYGERFWYEPAAIVYHSVPQDRIRKEYFLSWWFDKTRADVRQRGIPKDSGRVLAGVPIDAYLRITIWSLRWAFALSPRRRFSCKLNVWSLAGLIRECRRFRTASVHAARETAEEINSDGV
jgi:glycosyltransferase involved in cell wall biosynthesis